MKLILMSVLSLALLASCGGKEEDSKQQNIAVDDGSQVLVPADAQITDYSCESVKNYTESGQAYSTTASYSGTAADWKVGDDNFSFDKDSGGKFKSLVKYRRVKLDEKKTQYISEITDWFLENGVWSKEIRTIDRIRISENGVLRVIQNKINGVETPYFDYWSQVSTDLGNKTYRLVETHKNPSVLNKDGKVYSKYEITCVNVVR